MGSPSWPNVMAQGSPIGVEEPGGSAEVSVGLETEASGVNDRSPNKCLHDGHDQRGSETKATRYLFGGAPELAQLLHPCLKPFTNHAFLTARGWPPVAGARWRPSEVHPRLGAQAMLRSLRVPRTPPTSDLQEV